MVWVDADEGDASPGSLLFNIGATQPNQQLIVRMPDVPSNYVNVFGYLLYTNQDGYPNNFNALIESKIVVYNPTLVTFSNPNTSGSFQFYRPKKAGGTVFVRVYRLDP